MSTMEKASHAAEKNSPSEQDSKCLDVTLRGSAFSAYFPSRESLQYLLVEKLEIYFFLAPTCSFVYPLNHADVYVAGTAMLNYRAR